jgi:hypothetical protein
MNLRSRLNRLEKNEPPRSGITVDMLIRMQAIRKKGDAATPEERAFLADAKAQIANASPDDPVLRRIEELLEQKRTDPFYPYPNQIEVKMCQTLWDGFLRKAQSEGRDVTPAEWERFEQICRQQGVALEQLNLLAKPAYGLKELPGLSKNGEQLHDWQKNATKLVRYQADETC